LLCWNGNKTKKLKQHVPYKFITLPKGSDSGMFLINFNKCHWQKCAKRNHAWNRPISLLASHSLYFMHPISWNILQMDGWNGWMIVGFCIVPLKALCFILQNFTKPQIHLVVDYISVVWKTLNERRWSNSFWSNESMNSSLDFAVVTNSTPLWKYSVWRRFFQLHFQLIYHLLYILNW
jgi:hypothetical protein